MKDLKITFVKFYQGVNLASVSNQTSARVIEERSTNERFTVTIEKSAIGVLLTHTENSTGTKHYTEVPFNNLAYINYEPVNKEERSEDKEQKGATRSNAMKPKSASSEQ